MMARLLLLISRKKASTFCLRLIEEYREPESIFCLGVLRFESVGSALTTLKSSKANSAFFFLIYPFKKVFYLLQFCPFGMFEPMFSGMFSPIFKTAFQFRKIMALLQVMEKQSDLLTGLHAGAL